MALKGTAAVAAEKKREKELKEKEIQEEAARLEREKLKEKEKESEDKEQESTTIPPLGLSLVRAPLCFAIAFASAAVSVSGTVPFLLGFACVFRFPRGGPVVVQNQSVTHSPIPVHSGTWKCLCDVCSASASRRTGGTPLLLVSCVLALGVVVPLPLCMWSVALGRNTLTLICKDARSLDLTLESLAVQNTL